jgi:polysaccharide export outer membrane protein
MLFKRIVLTGTVFVFAAIAAASCVTTKQVAYLQDMEHESQISLEDKFEAVISPYDELDIVVSCFDSELAKPFNLTAAVSATGGSGSTTTRELAYLVDQNGNIEMPVLGTIHAAGLTRLRLQEEIRKMLINGNYIRDPFVMARFRNFKVFFLGSNGGKAITVPNERCTFLEALALSGDLNIYTNRSKIAVMREIDGKMVMRYLDPRSSKVFDDPFFMLQQNDFIITRDTGYHNFVQSYAEWTPFVNIFSTAISIVSLYLTYQILQNQTR